MRLEILDSKTLSLDDILRNVSELYYIASGKTGKLELTPVADKGILAIGLDDYLIVQISNVEAIDIPRPTKKYTPRNTLTYKYSGSDEKENIFVDFRAESGDIRVSFKDKESAMVYWEYFRDQFYSGKTGASVITVSNIYQDLRLVNWEKEKCDDWGWYTLDGGTCRYIGDVNKTKTRKMWGFTLKRPTKLYETKKREEH